MNWYIISFLTAQWSCKKFNKETGLFIKDSDGKPRIKIDIYNNPKIELLDTDGKSGLLN